VFLLILFLLFCRPGLLLLLLLFFACFVAHVCLPGSSVFVFCRPGLSPRLFCVRDCSAVFFCYVVFLCFSVVLSPRFVICHSYVFPLFCRPGLSPRLFCSCFLLCFLFPVLSPRSSAMVSYYVFSSVLWPRCVSEVVLLLFRLMSFFYIVAQVCLVGCFVSWVVMLLFILTCLLGCFVS